MQNNVTSRKSVGKELKIKKVQSVQNNEKSKKLVVVKSEVEVNNAIALLAVPSIL